MDTDLVITPRFWIFATLAGVCAAPAQAQTVGPELRARLAEWNQKAQSRAPGQWGVAIADERGNLLYGVEPHQMLIPASTVKLFTTGFARTVLGGDARISTRVLGNGELDPVTGAWNGTWSLEINGDPSLENPSGSGPRLADLARQLAHRGIRRLSGPLHVVNHDGNVASAEYPETWAERHRGRLFAPPVGELTLHENIVSITVSPGDRSGTPVEIIHDEPAGVKSLVTIEARTVSGRRSRLRLTTREDGGWVLSGTIGSGARPRHFGAVATRPRLVLSRAWAFALESAGIEWKENASNGPRPKDAAPYVLAEVTSPTLDSIAIDVNRRSLNLGAELMLQWAAADGAEALTAHVRELTEDTAVYLVDGSGLSGLDRASPEVFVSYLARLPVTERGRNFPLLLPANGVGTLERLSAGLPERGVVRAKTGTLRNVSTVTGYLGRQDGVLIISLMYNGEHISRARQMQWELFRLLGGDGVAIPRDSLAPEGVQFGGDDETSDLRP